MNKNHNHKFDIKGWHLATLYPLTILSIVGSLVMLTINIDSNWVDIASYIVFCIAALVTILSLQTSLLHSFGSTDFNSAYANAATSAGVCTVTAIMGAIMIIGSSKKSNYQI